MGITFANPALAWGALAAAIPVAIHLLQRRRPRPHPFPAIELVRRSRERSARRLRLRRLLLLAARTLLLLFLPLALARPQLARDGELAAAAAKGPAATALVLDASMSMGWRDGRSTLFDKARDDLRDVLSSLSAEEPVTVLVCDGGAAQAASPSFDRAAARRALDEARPTFLPADLTACVHAAARALGDSPLAGKRIHVATNLAAALWRLDGPSPSVPTEAGEVRPDVVIEDAARGRELPNRAIVDLAIAAAPEIGPRGRAFAVTVRNFASEPASDLAVELVVGDEVVAKGFLEIPAGGAATKKLVYRFPQAGAVTGALRIGGDALAADDERAFSLPIPRDLRALVVDGDPSPVRYRDEAFFVEAALRTGGASPLQVTTVDAESLPARDLDGFDLLLLLNVRAPDPAIARRIADFVESGGGLFVSVGDNVDADAYNAVLADVLPRQLHLVKTAAQPGKEGRPASFAGLDTSHPILRIFSGAAQEAFLGARTSRYFLLQPGPAEGILASFDDGAPALVEGMRGKGRILLFTSTVDRDWSDWAIQTSFLPTIQQTAAYLSRTLEEHRPRALRVGEAQPLVAPEGVQLASARGPDGKERPIEGGQATGIDRPGLYRVLRADGSEAQELAFAAHPDPIASDMRRLEPRELEAWFGGDRLQVEESPRSRRRQETPFWSLLAALAVVAFAAEGWLIRRS
ncbi:BatA domain-containing protein [Vulgatibacter incomptus]|uniref:VWFA domain-containing protein n=1 Tax=Vulgatibacter incomptus TaxID=1391653 RepID=A0A0K1PJ02_9BACT|nr:BatA domain-containing protein [Vulgatibacter incomptus]AKU93084.1 hypothetical protein AKJ08_3471 [Vulgatibacter incomptus]